MTSPRLEYYAGTFELSPDIDADDHSKLVKLLAAPPITICPTEEPPEYSQLAGEVRWPIPTNDEKAVEGAVERYLKFTSGREMILLVRWLRQHLEETMAKCGSSYPQYEVVAAILAGPYWVHTLTQDANISSMRVRSSHFQGLTLLSPAIQKRVKELFEQ